ncbi:OsmC family protein [Neptunomonas japonica]|uniref:Peroxiredoxin n=1 Tax=Neptunomonas japonica JAMM 1380 TaxID=1441457 RepID=A0A7R6SW07_9GAMM|nr:OsmC family protein [Neptunomonas japonica]BBB29265.1 peroxiredoxin [Neptunomonas japonica JAMM 1380]
MKKISVNEAQQPLRAQYKTSPETAIVTDHARTCGPDANDPFHSIVEPMQGCGVNVPIGVHHALGGLHDAPTPGDMLCAALAACQDSSIRMVANLLNIELEQLNVSVEAKVDVRGTMGIDKNVPVGFQNIHCSVQLRAKEGTDPIMLQKLQVAAERCCVVQQTLRNPPPIETVFNAS